MQQPLVAPPAAAPASKQSSGGARTLPPGAPIPCSFCAAAQRLALQHDDGVESKGRDQGRAPRAGAGSDMKAGCLVLLYRLVGQTGPSAERTERKNQRLADWFVWCARRTESSRRLLPQPPGSPCRHPATVAGTLVAARCTTDSSFWGLPLICCWPGPSRRAWASPMASMACTLRWRAPSGADRGAPPPPRCRCRAKITRRPEGSHAAGSNMQRAAGRGRSTNQLQAAARARDASGRRSAELQAGLTHCACAVVAIRCRLLSGWSTLLHAQPVHAHLAAACCFAFSKVASICTQEGRAARH